MGTTSISTESLTRTQLIDASLRQLGVSSPTSDERAYALEALNILLKVADVRGRWLWAVNKTPSTFSTVAARAYYTYADNAAPNNMLELEHVEWVSGSSYLPIQILSDTEFFNSELRDDTGDPIAIHLEKTPVLSNQKLWILPTPTAIRTIRVFYRRRLYDFTASTDNPDFPGHSVDYVKKALAAELAPEYGLPLMERQDMRLQAEQALRVLKGEAAEEAPAQTVQTLYF
jgi:hypothetical protein